MSCEAHLHGLNSEDSKYRFLMDDKQKKIRLYKKVGDRLIPLTVWTYDHLIEEMLSHDD